MHLESMPEVLRWDGDTVVFREVHDSYVQLLADRLGQELGHLHARDGVLGAPLIMQVRTLPEPAFTRFITAPETSCRLLWRASHSDEDVANFLRCSLAAELARAGDAGDAPAHDAWTALGDFCLHPDNSTFVAPTLPGLPPLDFDSPYATDLDFSGRAATTLVPRDRLDVEEQRLVLERLRSAVEGIRRVSTDVDEFVRAFTKTLILQRDPEAPGMFASGSSGQFIGRSVLSNPQLPKVDDVEVAEGLVHEAIHALLYMQEQHKRWVSPALYGAEKRTVSPWTGNQLPLRPYLQACFVWYGLLHFWAMALAKGVFPPARVRERIIQSTAGFLDDSFEAPLIAYRDEIADDLLDAISRMREMIRNSVIALT
jgi:hypothetical protein